MLCEGSAFLATRTTCSKLPPSPHLSMRTVYQEVNLVQKTSEMCVCPSLVPLPPSPFQGDLKSL